MTPNKWKGVQVDVEEPTELRPPPNNDHPDDPSTTHGTESLLLPVDDAVLAAGTVLGEYRVEAKIGEGGMGVVYAAVHPLIGKRAAVKVLKAELCRSQFNVERFIDEARVVNQIGHPNIVDVFAFGQTADGRSYFVMEWLKGETLRERMENARIDLPEICALVKPLARALAAAHEQGVIHRDLKPDNIFLVELRGEAPLVKLLDFGIAKLAREEHRMERTATGAMVGTPQYIAPEQAKGHAIDHRVDIYSLGCILFELLTGRPPFDADNAMEMVAKHLMETPPRPAQLADVPADLDDLVTRMLAKDADERPSLTEVAAIIERTSALERTSVRRVRARTPAPANGHDSGPIDIPTITPVASAPIGAAAWPSKAPSAGQEVRLTEDLAAVPRSRRGIVAALALGFVIAATAAYFLIARLGKEAPSAQPRVVTNPVTDPIATDPPAIVETQPIDQPPIATGGTEAPSEPEPLLVTPTKPDPPIAADPKSPPPVVDPLEAPNAPVVPRIKRDPPARPKRGRLQLRVIPPGAEILIDGRPGKPSSPQPLGQHEVEVRSAGFISKTVPVLVTEDGAQQTIKLEPALKAPVKGGNEADLMMPGSTRKR